MSRFAPESILFHFVLLTHCSPPLRPGLHFSIPLSVGYWLCVVCILTIRKL